MKTTLSLCLLAILLLAAPTRCFALWGIADVTLEEAKELGLEIRAKAAGPEDVRIELEFKIEGQLKTFDRVDLRVGDGDQGVVAALKEDRTKEGVVVVSFSADRKQLDKINLWIMVPEPLGGTAYQLPMKRFVDLDKVR